MSAPKVGDRVRLVIEGDVRQTQGSSFLLHSATERGAFRWYYVGHEPIVSVEVIPKPLKVGDTIEGEQYVTAPVGTVIRYETSGHPLIRTASGWYCAECEQSDIAVVSPRTVLLIPEATT